MPNVLAVDDSIPQERVRLIRYKVTLSGAYVQAVRGTATGEVLNLNGATNPKGLPQALWGKDGPTRVYPLNGFGGFGVEIVQGVDNLHPILKFFGTTPGTELAAGAYAAGVTGDLDTFIEAIGRIED
jgi:hypothetical protein